MKKFLLLLVAMTLALVGCSKVNAGEQAVEVDSWGSPTVSGCAKEESQVGTFSVDLYKYPARDISWDANSESGAERGPYLALTNSKEQAEMAIPVTIIFSMTNDCELLKQFHRDQGTKYQAWIGSDNPQGWNQLLQYAVGQPAEQASIAINQKYGRPKVWNNETVRAEYKNALQNQLPQEVKARTGGKEYFTDFVVTVGKPYPTNEGLRDSVEQQQASLQQATAAQIKAEADAKATEAKAVADANAAKAAAEAERAASIAKTDLARQEALQRQAEIAGFGTVEAWQRDQCMRTPNCKQFDPPVVIAPGVGPVNGK